jgi:phosphatidylglycerophosphatase A
MVQYLKLIIGSLFGSGYIPVAPGTWGSLVSVIILYPVAIVYGTAGLAISLITGSALSIWSADACEKQWGKDPGRMVIDEFAGMTIVFFWISFTGVLSTDIWLLISGFILFRIFDIFKPLGIDRLQHIPSGIGILADDLLAGLYALICLHLAIWMVSLL